MQFKFYSAILLHLPLELYNLMIVFGIFIYLRKVATNTVIPHVFPIEFIFISP